MQRLDHSMIFVLIAATYTPICLIALPWSWGIPVPGTSSALDYFDTLRQPALPANLIQAQRDYFGAHTYQRSDREGVFHTAWHGEEQPAEPVPLQAVTDESAEPVPVESLPDPSKSARP